MNSYLGRRKGGSNTSLSAPYHPDTDAVFHNMKTSFVRWIGLVIASLFGFVALTIAQTKPHALNISTRSFAGSGDNTLIVGFATSPGSTQMKVLIRGVGPGLTQFGITTAIKGVKMELWSGQTLLRTFGNWKNNTPDEAAARAAALTAGAFGLPEEGGDSAAVVFLFPNSSYTLKVMSLDGSVGVALIEVYELP